MSREATGHIETRPLSDGTLAFQLRFSADGRRERITLHERRGCACGCGGGWSERTAEVELANVLSRVRAGVWRKERPAAAVVRHGVPTFH